MTMPGFTAEKSLDGNKCVDYRVGNTVLNSEQRVIPQDAWEWNFPGGLRGLNAVMVPLMCAQFGGGMASKADGSVSCYGRYIP